jgi:hypothetical protein
MPRKQRSVVASSSFRDHSSFCDHSRMTFCGKRVDMCRLRLDHPLVHPIHPVTRGEVQQLLQCGTQSGGKHSRRCAQRHLPVAQRLGPPHHGAAWRQQGVQPRAAGQSQPLQMDRVCRRARAHLHPFCASAPACSITHHVCDTAAAPAACTWCWVR